MENPVPEQKPAGIPWYQRTGAIVTAFLCVGPLALPLVWINPRYDAAKKILGTVLMLAASWLLWVLMKDSYDRFMTQYRDLKAAMGV